MGLDARNGGVMGFLKRILHRDLSEYLVLGGVPLLLSVCGLIIFSLFHRGPITNLIESSFGWAFGLSCALYFLVIALLVIQTIYRLRTKDQTLGFSQLCFAAAAVVLIQLVTLVSIGSSSNWFPSSLDSPDDIREYFRTILELYLVVADTILKGGLLDFMESFDLHVSEFEPEHGLFAFNLTTFIFRSAWSLIFGAVAYIAFKRWRTALR